MDSNEEWVEKNIEKIYKHPLFDQFPKAAYYDVAVLGKNKIKLYIYIYMFGTNLICYQRPKAGYET
jgi:hypothetical protein